MRRKGGGWIAAGLLLTAAALCLAAYNLYDQLRAGQDAAEAVSQVEALVPLAAVETPEAVAERVLPDYLLDPEMEMPTETVDGQEYVGVLCVPALGLELAVISQWSYPGLRTAPCRYGGSAYTGDLIIAGHNYPAHFGGLKTLRMGDFVYFTDMDGNGFQYEVVSMEVLQPTAIEEMESGDWDLTLFTCTVGGRSRVTVRCRAVEPEFAG